MEVEFEATFPSIDKNEMRVRLKGVDADLIRSEFLQKRTVFRLPKGHEIPGGWIRVRDEGDKITISLKVIDGDTITDQKETMVVVDDYQSAVSLLKSLGCVEKAYQESRREVWKIGNVEIMIDEWPFLEAFVEIEGSSEEAVRETIKVMGLDYNDALFCSVATLYSKKYGIPEERINNHTPLITFAMENPFS